MSYVLTAFAQVLIWIWNTQQLEYVLLHEFSSFSSILKCECPIAGLRQLGRAGT